MNLPHLRQHANGLTWGSWWKSPVKMTCLPPKGLVSSVIDCMIRFILSKCWFSTINISSTIRTWTLLTRFLTDLEGSLSSSSRAVLGESGFHPRNECIVLPLSGKAAIPVRATTWYLMPLLLKFVNSYLSVTVSRIRPLPWEICCVSSVPCRRQLAVPQWRKCSHPNCYLVVHHTPPYHNTLLRNQCLIIFWYCGINVSSRSFSVWHHVLREAS